MPSFFGMFKRKKTTPITHADLEQRHVLSLRKKRFPTLTQFRYLPDYLSQNESFWIKALVGILIVSCLGIGIRWWHRNIVWMPKNGGSYTEGLIGFPRLINPILAIGNSTDSDMTRLFFPGLLTTNAQNEVVPDLAESLSISDDLKTYTFKLRPGLKWDDGETLNIDDVMFTFQLIQDPSYGSPWRATFANATFERTDDLTLTVTLKNPSAIFIRNFTIGILPLHRFADVPPSNFLMIEDNTRPVGAGPFKFKSLIRSKAGDMRSYDMVRNPLYHGKSPYLNELRFRFYPDITSAIEALRNREVQGIGFVPAWYSREDERIAGTQRNDLVLPQVTALFFNMKTDILKKKEVRRALVLGTDREGITQSITAGEALIADGPFAPGFIGFAPDLAPRPRIVPEAENLLDQAGYKRGDDGMRKKGNENLRFVITTVDQEPYPAIANIIKNNWKELGIEVEVQTVEPGRFTQDVLKPRRYQMLLYGELLDSTLDPYAFWHSSQALDPGLNFSIFVNKKVDSLLETARQERDTSKQHGKYQEVQRIIADEIPAIFIHTPVYDYLLPKSLKGVSSGNLLSPAERFTTISYWYKSMTPRLKSSMQNK